MSIQIILQFGETIFRLSGDCPADDALCIFYQPWQKKKGRNYRGGIPKRVVGFPEKNERDLWQS